MYHSIGRIDLITAQKRTTWQDGSRHRIGRIDLTRHGNEHFGRMDRIIASAGLISSQHGIKHLGIGPLGVGDRS